MVFFIEYHLNPNLTELAKFVKHEKIVLAQSRNVPFHQS